MNAFETLCPAPPSWHVRWDAIHAAFAWVRAMDSVPQEPARHGEGDVATHTRLAVQALAGLDEWRCRPAGERVRLFAAVLLHDVAKPGCTRTGDDGRITAPGHARRGDLVARRVLWEMGVPIAWREHVAALVRHHRLPPRALEHPDLDRIAFRVSLLARNDDLALLATADVLGRVCAGTGDLLGEVGLFAQYTAEAGCLDRPREFASDHARFTYFRAPGRDPGYAAYDDTRFTVTVMSGLPGAGKDHWIAAHRPGVPVVSLDDLRMSMGVRPADDQGAVVAAAYALARGHLRSATPYVWNATNVSRSLRSRCIELAAGYGARVELVSVEAPPPVVHARNRARRHPVPTAVIDRMAGRWELPDPTEAHHVEWVLNDSSSAGAASPAPAARTSGSAAAG